jgi:hypothetical protein
MSTTTSPLTSRSPQKPVSNHPSKPDSPINLPLLLQISHFRKYSRSNAREELLEPRHECHTALPILGDYHLRTTLAQNQKTKFKMNVITLYGTIKQLLLGIHMASYREMKRISA